jgi:hypothetical protein
MTRWMRSQPTDPESIKSVAHPLSLVSALLDAVLFAGFFFFERQQARRNNRPARRRVLITTGVLCGAGVVLAVLAFLPS